MKEAIGLARVGYEVTVLGVHVNRDGLMRDQRLALKHGFHFTSVLLDSGSGLLTRVPSLWRRVRSFLARSVFRFIGVESRWQLGHAVAALSRAADELSVDYFIAHLEPGIWAGNRLLTAGRRVGVDMEDWYSEDLLPDARKQRPVGLLRDLQRSLLRNGTHSTCPSESMSAALSLAYGCETPRVIYNAFPWSDRESIDGLRKDRGSRRASTIHWYSQVLGPGRGLEDLFMALPHIRGEVDIHLRGQPVAGLDGWLNDYIAPAWRSRVHIHDRVAFEELLSRIAEHDIGFAGEMKYCPSRDLTVTNKIMHYLLAGLAVVASDTAGQREVAEKSKGAVRIYPAGDPHALATQIDELVGAPEALARAKAAALAVAESTFCWERQEGVLLDIVSRAVRAPEGRVSSQ